MMFYSLPIKEIRRETTDCVSIAFDVPAEHRETFQYEPGQYLTFKVDLNGTEVRRSYSICSSPDLNPGDLRVAVKKVEGGQFSTFANESLKEGDVLESMKPEGNFTTNINSGRSQSYLFVAAGSGITPIVSILKSVLARETNSKAVLLYGNKSPEDTIFKNQIDELAAQSGDRFEVKYAFSRNCPPGFLEGRIDRSKLDGVAGVSSFTEYFICGPEVLIRDTEEYLESKGVDKKQIRYELFTTPVTKFDQQEEVEAEFDGTSQVTVIMDDEEFDFELSAEGEVILDAAMDNGVDAPFSCKGAVCCTCKAKVVDGKVRMEMNYALSDEEVEEGYVLTCQAHPDSAKVVVDYDQI
jgi:ring-1,2-phenylacetyl-CoA epoxidase subunit PaaE